LAALGLERALQLRDRLRKAVARQANVLRNVVGETKELVSAGGGIGGLQRIRRRPVFLP